MILFFPLKQECGYCCRVFDTHGRVFKPVTSLNLKVSQVQLIFIVSDTFFDVYSNKYFVFIENFTCMPHLLEV